MKKTIIYIALVLLSQGTMFSLTNSSFTFGGGLSLPSNSLSDFRNGETLDYNKNDSVIQKGILKSESINAGYSIYAKMKFSMTNSLFFYGQISWNKFPVFYSTLYETSIDKILKPIADLKVQGSLVPLLAGLNYYFYDRGIGVYGIGDLSYNFMTYSFEIGNNQSNISIPPSVTDTRLGFGVGLGTQLKFDLFKINLEGKFNNLNLIGKVTDEQTKVLYQILLGIEF